METLVQTDDQNKPLAKGDYVLATKYADGDPGDPWAVGFYSEPGPPSGDMLRYRVVHADERIIYGPNGFRRIRRGLRADVGAWLIENSDALERSPPGTVNLWTMLTAQAFDDDADRSAGGGGADDEQNTEQK
jgi:hypothetical protein